MGEITITVEEYKSLLETSVRVGAFIDFVKSEKFSVGREDCCRYLGFEEKDRDGDD